KKIDELIKYHEFIEKAIVYIKTRIFSLVSIKNNTKMEDNVFYTSYILPKIKHIEKHCEELDHYIENFFVLSKFFGNFSIPNLYGNIFKTIMYKRIKIKNFEAQIK